MKPFSILGVVYDWRCDLLPLTLLTGALTLGLPKYRVSMGLAS